ncbi:plasmid transfer protein [Chondrinema litorale]|uniref:plasmid transfer protein n=1 Tax=Chondrinema litorale TaxID=2994555 RepID=UPI002543273E|nr:plasmid transfer protein [Chondrinema litorale]UZR99617.1 plasmid transfer protein [Chondrinema litorale]
MREIIDEGMLDLLGGMYSSMEISYLFFAAEVQGLCAIFMFLHFGVKSYGMMVGDQRLQVLPLLRPFAIAMVVIFWGQFVSIINEVTGIITNTSKVVFEMKVSTIDALQLERMELIDDIATKLIESSAELENVQESDDESWYETLGVDFSSLLDPIKGYYIIIISKFRFMLVQLIEFLVLTIFQVSTYIVFFLQAIFSAVLVTFGPFSFAISILPAFKDAYVHWLSRFVAVALYSAIGYLVLFLSLTIVQYGMMQEIEFLKYVMDNEAAFIAYVSSNDGGTSFYIIGLLLGSLGMLSVPVISTWIVATSGVGSAITGALHGATRMVTIGR